MLGDESPDFNNTWQKLCPKDIVSDIEWYAAVTENVADNVLPSLTLALSIIGLIVNCAFIFFGWSAYCFSLLDELNRLRMYDIDQLMTKSWFFEITQSIEKV